MTIFYRGHCVLITHEVFEVQCPSYQSFALRGLSGLRVVEQAADPPPAISAARIASTGVAGAVAVAAAVGWAEGWVALESPAVAIALLALLVASMITSGVCWRVRACEQELIGLYQGHSVSMYRSLDRSAFDQVKRGLLRALERLGDTG